MILVDTSVWVEYLRFGTNGLGALLADGKVACHPFIIGELACGNMENRKDILSLLHRLPQVLRAEDDEVMGFIEYQRLMGKGLGYIDIHLLVSARLTGISLWTLDKRLHEASVAILPILVEQST